MDNNKMIFNSYRNAKETTIDNTILKKKSKIGGLLPPVFKAYYKATISRQCDTGKITDKSINGTK